MWPVEVQMHTPVMRMYLTKFKRVHLGERVIQVQLSSKKMVVGFFSAPVPSRPLQETGPMVPPSGISPYYMLQHK